MENDNTGYGYLIVFLVFYFFPYLLAAARGHHQKLAIFMTDLLLGWTLIGWVVALIWACTAVIKPNPVQIIR